MEDSIAIRTHYLKVLTEMELYQQVKLLYKDPNIKSKDELNKEKEKTIEKFIEEIPQELKSLKDCRKIINDTLEKVDKSISKIKERESSEER